MGLLDRGLIQHGYCISECTKGELDQRVIRDIPGSSFEWTKSSVTNMIIAEFLCFLYFMQLRGMCRPWASLLNLQVSEMLFNGSSLCWL